MTFPTPEAARPRAALAVMVTALLVATTSEAVVVRHPDTSTLYQVNFAVAYRECTTPNTTNSVGVPACAPPVTSTCSFGGGGFSLRRRDRDALALQLDGALSNVSGPGSCPTGPYTLQLRLRMTLDDAACATGSCTLVDGPITIPLLQHNDDFLLDDFVLESAFPGPVPALANYEILSAVVVAPDGLPIAAAGVDPASSNVRGNLTVGYAACTAPDTANAWGVPACSGPVWASPCDFRFASFNMGSRPPATRLRADAEDLVGAPPECANGTYSFAPRLRVTTNDCGGPCTLVDVDQPYPVAVEHGEIVDNPLLAEFLPFPLLTGDVLELVGARLLDPFGNLLGAIGATPSLRLARARFRTAFRDPSLTNDDQVTIKGRLPFPRDEDTLAPLVDPTVGGVTIAVNDKNGVTWSATIPGAAWEVRTPGRKWRYKDDLGTIDGIRKAELTETRFNGSPNGYKVQVVAKDTDASGADLPAVDVAVVVSTTDGGTVVASTGIVCKVSSRRVSCK